VTQRQLGAHHRAREHPAGAAGAPAIKRTAATPPAVTPPRRKAKMPRLEGPLNQPVSAVRRRAPVAVPLGLLSQFSCSQMAVSYWGLMARLLARSTGAGSSQQATCSRWDRSWSPQGMGTAAAGGAAAGAAAAPGPGPRDAGGSRGGRQLAATAGLWWAAVRLPRTTSGATRSRTGAAAAAAPGPAAASGPGARPGLRSTSSCWCCWGRKRHRCSLRKCPWQSATPVEQTPVPYPQ